MKIIRPVTVADSGTFTRASVATYYDSAGALQTAAVDTPRFGYDPTNLARGPILLIEAAATNVLLNSAVVATQTVTVTAGQYTLAFNGIGSVTLSGAATGIIAGLTAGRTTTSFTTTAGPITLTVTGSLTLGQLEAGSTSTSYIATTSAPATRAADVNTATMLSNVPETDYPVWNVSTTYPLAARVLHPTNHKIYESTAAGNVGHAPPNISYWLDCGFDNRWEMFDQSVTSQTSQNGTVCVALTPGARVDSIAGLNVAAANVTVNAVDPTYGLVYSKQIPLTSYGTITDWYSYFYEPIVQLTDFILTDMPASFSTCTITVCFSATTPAIGGQVIGQAKDNGVAEWSTKVAIIDYSVKTKDSFGNYVITPRNFSKRADFSIKVETSTVDALQTLLAGYRSVPVVYVGDNPTSTQKFASTIIYGFYKDFSIDISYPSVSTCTLQVEGLT